MISRCLSVLCQSSLQNQSILKYNREEIYKHFNQGGSLVLIPPLTGEETWIMEQAEIKNERKQFQDNSPNVAEFISEVETDYSDSNHIIRVLFITSILFLHSYVTEGCSTSQSNVYLCPTLTFANVIQPSGSSPLLTCDLL
jgi:hypothetical protein